MGALLEDVGSQEARKTCRPEEGMRYCDLLKEDLESLIELPVSAALSAVGRSQHCDRWALAL